MPDAPLPSPLTKKVDNFLDYLSVERGCSPLTLRNYRHYLIRFASWFSEDGKAALESISMDTIHNYRLYLSKFESDKGQGLGKKTQSYHVIALRSFLKWLVKNDVKVLAPEKVELPKI